jgi:hypothetical protein
MSVITHAFADRPGISYHATLGIHRWYVARYFRFSKHHRTIRQTLEQWLDIKFDLIKL